jgi:undecaprenyl pyrophosphate synthase
MKTVMEQLMEIQDKLDALKAQSTEYTTCCSGVCTCDDEMPSEFDSAGFSIEDRESEPKIEFTREQLLTFATKLAERVIDKCKEAVTDTNIDADNVVDLSMGYGHQIEVELDTDAIARSIHDEIDGTIELDVDSIEDEVRDIMTEMDMIQKN